MATPELYLIEPVSAPWGDYGNVLTHGMAENDDDDSDDELVERPILLERTGPFVPPITFPGVAAFVVDAGLRKQLKASGLGPLEFRKVEKKRIVRLDWHLWDRTASEPAQYPKSGEPEDFVLGRRHDPAVASAMGALWEVVAVLRPDFQRGARGFDVSLYRGEHVIRASRPFGYVFVSADLKRVLESLVPSWVRFRKAKPWRS